MFLSFVRSRSTDDRGSSIYVPIVRAYYLVRSCIGSASFIALTIEKNR